MILCPSEGKPASPKYRKRKLKGQKLLWSSLTDNVKWCAALKEII